MASEPTTPKRQRVAKQKPSTPIKVEKPDPKALAQSPSARQKVHARADPSPLDSLSCITPDAGQLAHPEAMKLFSEVKVN